MNTVPVRGFPSFVRRCPVRSGPGVPSAGAVVGDMICLSAATAMGMDNKPTNSKRTVAAMPNRRCVKVLSRYRNELTKPAADLINVFMISSKECHGFSVPFKYLSRCASRTARQSAFRFTQARFLNSDRVDRRWVVPRSTRGLRRWKRRKGKGEKVLERMPVGVFSCLCTSASLQF